MWNKPTVLGSLKSHSNLPCLYDKIMDVYLLLPTRFVIIWAIFRVVNNNGTAHIACIKILCLHLEKRIAEVNVLEPLQWILTPTIVLFFTRAGLWKTKPPFKKICRFYSLHLWLVEDIFFWNPLWFQRHLYWDSLQKQNNNHTCNHSLDYINLQSL